MKNNNQNPQNLPADILQAIESSDVYTKLEKIADRYSLLLDQLGTLNMYTERLMIGKIKTSDFVETIEKDLEIPNSIAAKIASDINHEVFEGLRESLRNMQEEKEILQTVSPVPITPPAPELSHAETISAIEKAGNFTFEKALPAPSSTYNTTTLKKEEVLKHLDNPPTSAPSATDQYRESI